MINKNIFIRTVSLFMLVFICTFFFGCGVSENKIASITYQNSNGDKVIVKSYYVCEVDKAYIVDYTTREELMVLYENDGNKSYYIGGSPNSQGFTANVYYNSSDIPYAIRNKGTSFAVGPKIPRGAYYSSELNCYFLLYIQYGKCVKNYDLKIETKNGFSTISYIKELSDTTADLKYSHITIPQDRVLSINYN